MIVRSLIYFLVLLCMTTVANGQENPDKQIDAATRTQLIATLKKILNGTYVSVETARRIETDLDQRIKNNEYANITSAKELAKKLQADLQAVSNDKHLRVYYSSEPLAVTQKSEPTEEEKKITLWFEKRHNWGFAKFERLEGNIGYLQLNAFEEPDNAMETLTAAMNLLTNTDALIIDLRQNGGGSPVMVKLISSYFFGRDSVHLNDVYWRENGRTEQYWTNPVVQGKKYLDKPVFILTSNYTFSAAEAFAYNMKNLKRATVIGETTRGGANIGERIRLSDHFEVWVASGQAVNPVTRSSWEGVGVAPDISVPKEKALKAAYILALREAIPKVPYNYIKSAMEDIIKETQKQIDEMDKKKN